MCHICPVFPFCFEYFLETRFKGMKQAEWVGQAQTEITVGLWSNKQAEEAQNMAQSIL